MKKVLKFLGTTVGLAAVGTMIYGAYKCITESEKDFFEKDDFEDDTFEDEEIEKEWNEEEPARKIKVEETENKVNEPENKVDKELYEKMWANTETSNEETDENLNTESVLNANECTEENSENEIKENLDEETEKIVVDETIVVKEETTEK